MAFAARRYRWKEERCHGARNEDRAAALGIKP